LTEETRELSRHEPHPTPAPQAGQRYFRHLALIHTSIALIDTPLFDHEGYFLDNRPNSQLYRPLNQQRLRAAAEQLYSGVARWRAHEQPGQRREREEAQPNRQEDKIHEREEPRELNGTDECPICLEDLSAKYDGKVTIFECSHAIHTTCYDGFKRASKNQSCPQCKEPLKPVCKTKLR